MIKNSYKKNTNMKNCSASSVNPRRSKEHMKTGKAGGNRAREKRRWQGTQGRGSQKKKKYKERLTRGPKLAY